MQKNLKRLFTLTAILYGIAVSTPMMVGAQGPLGRNFGFGLSIGNPLGGTIKYWTASDQALAASLGADYFGSPRLNVDYHWHFDAFNSDVVKLYAGPGLAIGFGGGREYLWYKKGHDYYFYREDGKTGIGGRVLLGLNLIPRRSPIEMYVELGPLVGLSPAFGTSVDVALGVRFYP
jgi:hypothetical protein